LIRTRLIILNSLLLLTLLASHWGRRLEGATVAHTDFLQKVHLAFRDWKASEVPIPPSELRILEPDGVLIRRYTAGDGQWAELAVIAGHRKRSIHTPAFCMAGGGWATETQNIATLALPGQTISGMRMLMVNGDRRNLVTYFFTDGAYTTGNLVQFQGAQMLKRFGAQVPLGALVRIQVPVGRDPAEAEALTAEFAQATLPTALAALRNTHLTTK